ncbi:MAG: CBS domain-containing protein [Deltaproteobacteria bacterium]|nr:CBS domain-containing protein [Deltaproteobacteria bacterium]
MLRAQDIMTREVVSVTADTAIEDLARLLVEKKVSAVPVVDAGGRLMGIISEGDLLQRDKPLHIPTVISIFDWVLYLESSKKFEAEVKKISARKVGELCSREVVTCTPETPVTEIAQLMVGRHVHLVPVVDEGKKVVGVVARLDVIRSLEL